MKKNLVIFTLLVLIPVLASGCSGGGQAEKTVNVSAAVSLKDVLGEITEAFTQKKPGVRLSFNYASSGTIQQQIEQGAPVDLFISAGKKQMDDLLNQGLVGTPQTIAGNDLVLVIPSGSSKTINSLQELKSTWFQKIAMGNPAAVPAGKYALEALKKEGVLNNISPRLVLAKDVRQVLIYVETGNAEAGFVYRTDALKSGKVKVGLAVPPDFHSPVVYLAAVVKRAQNGDEAGRFLEFLKTAEARQIFKKYGFTEPAPS